MVETGRSCWHDATMEDRWTKGYSSAELDAAQDRYGLRFPPDLVALLLDRRPVDGWDWRSDHEGIGRALAHPLAGLLFDVEYNDLWWDEWGSRPACVEERSEILTTVVLAAPRLVPLLAIATSLRSRTQQATPCFR